MTTDPSLYKSLHKRIFSAPGGTEWESLLSSHPDLGIYIAGGCVRDELLRRFVKAKDFDFFVVGPTEKALHHLAARGDLKHGQFGSPRWFPQTEESIYYDIIPVVGFYNGLWRCENITDALNQFDFTANAVAVDLRTGALFNPQNGIRDINNRIMRAVRFDYPDEPISDAISLTRPEIVWFRILHYAATLGFTIEPITFDWLKANERYALNAERFAALFFPLHVEWQKGLIQS